MSKQATLFSSWGVQDTHKPSPQDNPPDEFDDDLGLTEQDMEELCKMEEEATTPQTSGSFHVGPSHAFLNSSIIEEGIPGFDEEAGQLWIYPTNYPLRDYQYNVVHKALFTNTLVCLPTGLGKTFIAAVVMYNFYRWYPNGKIVFLAPTKPLVTQQIEACHSVMGIPQEHTAEMTGHLSPKTRVSLWQQRRVFFLTPQVMQNDLIKGTCPALDVCCVVFDEAHKALGNHAYCQVVRELTKVKVRFRVLALSATPGNDLRAVQQVVTNLQIGHIELRSEDSIDIQRYVNERTVEKIVVPLEGEIMEIKRSFVMILNGILSHLVKYGVFYQSSPDRLTKYQLLQSREKFRVTGPPAGVLPGAVEGDFAVAISLFHAFELLLQHGMRSFYQFLATTFTGGGSQSRAKGDIVRSSQFRHIMSTLGERVAASKGPINVTDGPSFPRKDGGGKRECLSQRSFFYSHPKLRRLEDVVIDHFRQCQSDPNVHTRVMIFSQYRDSVQEIADMLERHAPLVKVMTFVGHSTGKSSSKGLSQREQTEIVRRFREGGYNTLVATCVGEEGLDIGDVDLIVCFDAPKSPIRLVQRMGRTGRKRKGRIVMIVAEGKEEQGYTKSQSNKKSIHRAICNGRKSLTFYQLCHRMVPKHIHPQVHKMHMSVGEFVGSKKDTKIRQSTSNHGLVKQRANGKKIKKGTYLNDQELNCWSEGLSLTDREFTAIKKSVQNCFSPSPMLCLSNDKVHSNRRKSMNASLNTSRTTATFSLGLDKWVDHQVHIARTPAKIIHSSNRSEKFASILEFIDLLRTSEGMGESYDLEMQTYLDATSVNAPTCSNDKPMTRTSLPDDSPVPVKKKSKSRKKAHYIDDSDSEDHDMATDASSAHISTENYDSTSRGTSKNTSILLSERDQSNQSTSNSSSSLNYPLTQSGHVVPRAPSEDDLDWLDDLEPSQLTSTSFSHSRGHSSVKNDQEEQSEFWEADSDLNAADFDCDTPDLPVFSGQKSRLLPSKCSTPASAFKVPSMTVCGTPTGNPKLDKSCDLFNDLSANAIFDDFSTSCIEDNAGRSSRTTPNGHNPPRKSSSTVDVHVQSGRGFSQEQSYHTTPKKTAHSNSGRVDVIVLSDSDDEHCGDVHLIEESDLEEENQDNSVENNSGLIVCVGNNTTKPDQRMDPKSPQLLPFGEKTPNSDEDSFLGNIQRCRKRPLKSRNFLQSPDTPAPNASLVSPGSKENKPVNTLSSSTPNVGRCKKRLKVTFDCESSGDEFDTRPLKRAKWRSSRSAVSTSRPTDKETCSDFLEEEAEVSDDGYTEADSVLMGDSEYDFDDSFINDNSMLTQMSPSQRTARTPVKKKISKTDANSNNFYLRSLMSPEDHLFTTKRRGCGSKYRMVFSQRHELLNHYINKAGFNVDQTKRKTQKREFVEADSSSSEAEEVYGLEECEPSESSQYSSESTSTKTVSDSKPAPMKKRKAAFLSDSDPSLMDDDHCYIENVTENVSTKRSRTAFLCDSKQEDKGSRAASENMRLSVVNSQVKESADDEVIISPSLLASIKLERPPQCYSLGMDEWIDWDDLSD